MIGGGIAGILALQVAGAFDGYKKERSEPSYTVRMPVYGNSPTAICSQCCMTGMPTAHHTAEAI